MAETLTCPTCAAVIGIPNTGIPQGGIECVWCGTKCSQQAIERTVPKKVDPAQPQSPSNKSQPQPQSPSSSQPQSESQPRTKPQVKPPVRFMPPTVEETSPPVEETPPPKRERAKSKFIREEYEASDDPDDMLPYLVEAKEITTEKCESCHLDRPFDAIICPHCGYDIRTKKRVQREYEPISKTWILGWPLRVRMTIFIICLFINLFTFGAGYVLNHEPPATLFGAFIVIVLQAFLLGTYSRLTVKRNRKGQSQIVIQWRYCFLSAPEQEITTRHFSGVVAGSYAGMGFSEIVVLLILLMGALTPMFAILFDGPTIFLVIELIVPLVAAGFWSYFAMWSIRYYSALTTENNYPDTYLYRGLSQAKSQEITRTVAEATGLPTVGGV